MTSLFPIPTLELVRICESSYVRLGGGVLLEICLIGAKSFWFIKERSTALKSKLHSDEDKRKKVSLVILLVSCREEMQKKLLEAKHSFKLLENCRVVHR